MKDVPVFATALFSAALFLWFVTCKIYDDYRGICKCTGGNLFFANGEDLKYLKAIGIVSDLVAVF